MQLVYSSVHVYKAVQSKSIGSMIITTLTKIICIIKLLLSRCTDARGRCLCLSKSEPSVVGQRHSTSSFRLAGRTNQNMAQDSCPTHSGWIQIVQQAHSMLICWEWAPHSDLAALHPCHETCLPLQAVSDSDMLGQIHTTLRALCFKY